MYENLALFVRLMVFDRKYKISNRTNKAKVGYVTGEYPREMQNLATKYSIGCRMLLKFYLQCSVDNALNFIHDVVFCEQMIEIP